MDRDEEILRGSFAALRREDEPLAPEFASLWRNKVRASRRHRRWLVAAASVVVVLIGIFWLRSARRRPEINTSAAITQWKAPTDFLLDTPGREFLRAVPEIGAWRGYTDLTLPSARPSPGRKDSN